MSNEADTVELRSCGSTYVLLCFVPSLLVLFSIYLNLRVPTGREGLLGAAALLGLVAYIAWSFRVRLSPSGIEYRGPFFTRGDVGWSAVHHGETGARIIPGPRTPPCYLTLYPHDDTKPVIVNIKPFSRADLRRLVQYIQAHAPAAALDATTQAMVHGQFPSVIRGNRHGVV